MSLALCQISKKSWECVLYSMCSSESCTCFTDCSVTWIVSSQHSLKKSRESDLKRLHSFNCSRFEGMTSSLCFHVSSKTLRNSNILQPSNNIPLLSLNLLSSRLGLWWCVVCCGIRGGFSLIMCSQVVCCITDSLWRETFEKGYKSMFWKGAAAWCVLDTVETEVSLWMYEEDLGWAGLGCAGLGWAKLICWAPVLSPGSFSIKQPHTNNLMHTKRGASACAFIFHWCHCPFY